jgi:hypothetical protein
LTPTLINQGFKPALDTVERDWREQWRTAKKNKDKNGGKGAVIIVGRRDQDKFFSNGESLVFFSMLTVADIRVQGSTSKI